MSSIRVCPICAAPLAADAPAGLCPQCLLKAALSGQSAADTAITGAWNSDAGTATIPPSAGVKLRYVGDYELLEEIARGGMGIVWRAKQISLNRTVAVKTIRAGALATDDDVQRFLREAEAAANLQHPNIVAIHEVGEHHGQYYFSMDYIAGRDLAAIRRDGPMPPQQIAALMKTIAETIHFAHQRGTLHRDLKPQNILIDESGEPRITDFGLAKLTGEDSRLTQTGVVMGSPSYMPPEQAAGNLAEIGPHSDVYSLGAILYELLTGRPPFQGATPMATLRAVMDSEPTAPHKLNADGPPDLETICLKCLEKSPNQRYHSARELADDLSRYLRREPILAKRASMLRRASNWFSRHPGALATIAAVAMLALALTAFYLVEENRFLRAQRANPALERKPGDFTAALVEWSGWRYLSYVIGVLLILAIDLNRKRLTWRSVFDPSDPARTRSPEPMTPNMRTIATGAGIVFITYGLALAAQLIHIVVWEGPVGFRDSFTAFWCVWVGALFVAGAVRDRQIAFYGRSSRQLTAEQLHSIEEALYDETDIIEAIRRYRQAAPDAQADEARTFVLQKLAHLRTQSPERIRPRRLTLATLNWRAFTIGVAIECAVIGSAFIACSRLASDQGTIYDFILGGFSAFCAIPIIVLTIRGANFWRRWLAGILIGATYLAGTIIRPRLVDSPASDHSLFTLPFACGLLLGGCLVLSLLTRRRGQ
jgi:serine/threonine protein kinase